MKIRRAAVAVAITGALVLSACSSDDDAGEQATETQAGPTAGPEGPDGQPGGTADPADPPGVPDPVTDPELAAYQAIGAPFPGTEEFTGKPDLSAMPGGSAAGPGAMLAYSAGEREYHGYNRSLPDADRVGTRVINDRISSGFWYQGSDGVIYPDPTFGSYQVISDDPFTVEYTIAADAVWEDGTPISYNDFLLQWVATNPVGIYGEPAADGEPSGPWQHSAPLLGQVVPDPPVGELDGRTFTLEYRAPHPDWRVMLNGAQPAHVAAAEAGLTPEELVAAIQDGDAEALEPVAAFWNTGWNFTSGELPDPALVPSSGPYSLDGASWEAGAYLQLVPNPNYWGAQPATESLTFRVADVSTHIQGLANRDLHVIEPPANADTLSSIQNLGDSITVEISDMLAYDHLSFQFAQGSPFAEANGGLAAREAFASCVPRTEIVQELLHPVNPNAVVMNVRELFPFQAGYADQVAAAYDTRFDAVDLDVARERFEESGLDPATEVRIAYSAGSERRARTVEMIAERCNGVGFDVVAAPAEQLGPVLLSGDWEVALFAWADTGRVTDNQEWYTTDGTSNYGNYSNEAIDEAWARVSSTADPAIQQENLAMIDKIAWDTLHSVPLYTHPRVVAYDSRVLGVVPSGATSRAVWNAEQWRME